MVLQTIIITLLVISAPFVWVWYKHWNNAKEAEKIYWYAKIKFEDECGRLDIRSDKQFSDMYTASFIRCDDTKESIAVYAGQSNRFAVIPYRDLGMVLCSSNGGVVPVSGNTQYITTTIGSASITTEYSPSQAHFYVTGYTPEILILRNGVMCDGIPGFIFDPTGKIGKSRIEKTNRFCENANSGMECKKFYASSINYKYKKHIYKKGEPGQSYLEWKKEWDERERALANKPDPYGSHSI